jgi:hypothetical protein
MRVDARVNRNDRYGTSDVPAFKFIRHHGALAQSSDKRHEDFAAAQTGAFVVGFNRNANSHHVCRDDSASPEIVYTHDRHAARLVLARLDNAVRDSSFLID